MNLILLGPPGAGKGTQAVRIAEKKNLLHLSSGDILREERKAKTELGLQAQDFMDRGDLVPDDLILSMMMVHIEKAGAYAGFLLDGFPRTVAQADGLNRRLAEKGEKLHAVVRIDVPRQVLLDRLTGRLYCPKCGRTYHIKFSPPKVEGICDVSGEKLLPRLDDTLEKAKWRLEVFEQQTAPLSEFYEREKMLRVVSGVGDKEEISDRILEACGE